MRDRARRQARRPRQPPRRPDEPDATICQRHEAVSNLGRPSRARRRRGFSRRSRTAGRSDRGQQRTQDDAAADPRGSPGPRPRRRSRRPTRRLGTERAADLLASLLGRPNLKFSSPRLEHIEQHRAPRSSACSTQAEPARARGRQEQPASRASNRRRCSTSPSACSCVSQYVLLDEPYVITRCHAGARVLSAFVETSPTDGTTVDSSPPTTSEKDQPPRRPRARAHRLGELLFQRKHPPELRQPAAVAVPASRASVRRLCVEGPP